MMKFAHSTKNSAGIGLIEVLVTAVVISVGLLAVASLQGDLIVGSRTNKTRAECQALANTKIEQLRETIEKTGTSGYNALASSTDGSISGVTGTFSRSSVVTNQIFDNTAQTWSPATFDSATNTWGATTPTSGHTYGPAVIKNITVTVSWGTGTENQCAVQSVIAFDTMGNTVLSAKGAGTGIGTTVGGQSLNAESSDDITQTINLPSTETPPSPGSVATVDGKTYIVNASGTQGLRADQCNDSTLSLTAFENGLYTRRVNHDGLTGDEAIELYEKVVVSEVDYCIPRIRYNGGVIIPIRGIVHSGATTGTGNNQTLLDVSLFTFNTSESGTYCVFKPEANAKSAPYVCYVGGSCQYGPNGVSAAVTECPDPAVSGAIVGPGGWRGKVGLLGVASNGRNVCFSEELAGSPDTVDTARNYYARNGGLNEGINKPYSCHDFLIINGKNTAAQVHSECVAQANAIGGFHLASKTIQRDITGINVFDPTIDTSFCVGTTGTAYTITGDITGASTLPTITVSDGTTTNICTATTSSYTCNITTTANAVTISGVYNSQPVSCNVSLSSTTSSATGCSLNFTVLPTYTITGYISATTAEAANAVSLVVIDGSNTVACTNNMDYNNTYSTYTCSISTASTSGITINATAANGYAVTPATYAVPTLSGSTSTIVVPTPANDFVASVVITHTISGTISIGNNVTLTTVTAAVDTGAGTCTLTGTHAANSSDSYSCSVPSGANHLSIAISPACSTGGGSKKYQLSDGTTTTLGAGSLVFEFSNITGNISKNISITKSSTNC